MIYVISDLHGYPHEKFLELLDRAGFGKGDYLYILGDVIDRNGDGGVETLQWLIYQTNAEMILGNHEASLLACSFVFDELTEESIDALTDEKLDMLSRYDNDGGSVTLKAMKQLYYERLMKMESTYGRLGSQMHPEDFMRQIGPEYFSHTANLQDAAQLMVDAPEGVFDYENSEGDRHFRDLTDYYVKLSNIGFLYSTGKGHFSTEDMMHQIDENAIPKELEERISGPSMDKKQEAAYQKGLRKRLGKEFLFGRFR